jgi:hypothetical protein
MVHATDTAATIPAAMAEATAVGMAEVITLPGAVIRAAMVDPTTTAGTEGDLPVVMGAGTPAGTAGAITAAVMAEAIPVATVATVVDTAATAAVTTGVE